MAARAYWQGQIKLALVSIPVEVYPATKSGAAISFHQIHEPSGKRIRYEKVAPGVGPVDPDEIMKGYEVSKGNYVLLDDEEIEAVKIESRKTLDLVQFVDADEIDVLYYEKPYFVVPADDLAEEAYAVLRDALRQTRKVGLGQLSVRGREQLVSIKPCGRGLVMEVLRYADEVHKAQSYFRDIGDAKPEEDLLDLATTLIEKKRKAKGGERILEDVGGERPSGGNVIDLMAALKKSVGEGGGARAAKSGAPKAATARKSPARKTPAKAAPKRKSA
ncbi:MAG: Ku protein [Sphingomonadales bacterium]|nr:Ku protein [Sphingomonadales bacterium]